MKATGHFFVSVHPFSAIRSAAQAWNLIFLILEVKLVVVSELQENKDVLVFSHGKN